MYYRIKSYTNKDGSQRHYLYLVETRRTGGRVRQVTVANLGRVEQMAQLLPDLVQLSVIHKNHDLFAIISYTDVIIIKIINSNPAICERNSWSFPFTAIGAVKALGHITKKFPI